jgi:hypothetical protein
VPCRRSSRRVAVRAASSFSDHSLSVDGRHDVTSDGAVNAGQEQDQHHGLPGLHCRLGSMRLMRF